MGDIAREHEKKFNFIRSLSCDICRNSNICSNDKILQEKQYKNCQEWEIKIKEDF